MSGAGGARPQGGSAGTVKGRILDAMDRRAQLGIPALTTGYRLVHERWDGLPGLWIDRLNEVAFIRYRDPVWAGQDMVATLVESLKELGLRQGVWVWDAPQKVIDTAQGADAERAMEFAGDFALPRPSPGGEGTQAAAPLLIREGDKLFELDPWAGFSFGLFFDMRPCRLALAEHWQGRRVLNLFAYTCGFGVALGQGNEVVNVDTSRASLSWGERNYAHNGIPVEPANFVARDAFAWLERAVEIGNHFDAIVLDPPSYSAGKKGRSPRFRLTDELPRLVDLALRALKPGGELFVAANTESLSQEVFRHEVERAARRHGLVWLRGWNPPGDYPAPLHEFHLKTALVGPQG